MTAQFECYQKIMQDPIQQTEGKHHYLSIHWYISKRKPSHYLIMGFLGLVKNESVANFSDLLGSFNYFFMKNILWHAFIFYKIVIRICTIGIFLVTFL